MKLIVKQSNIQEQVSSELIDKLYQITSGGVLTNDSELQGSLITQVTYEDAVVYLRLHFPNLIITANTYYIRFADEEVVRVLTAKGIIPEGGGITAAQASELPTGGGSANQYWWSSNTTIKEFDEIKYFGRLKNGSYEMGQWFTNATNLESVDLTGFTKLRGYLLFSGCKNLEYFHGRNNTPNTLNLEDLTLLNATFKGCLKLYHIASLGSITYIGDSVFEDCTNLETVNLPSSCINLGRCFKSDSKLHTINLSHVTALGHNTFNGCSSLEYCDGPNSTQGELNLPNLTGTLGSSTFENCNKLTSIASLGSITSIGNFTFQNCTNLAIINFPSTITSVGNNAFNNTAWYNNQPDGEVIIGSCLYKYKGTLTGSYSVPNNITYITAGAYADKGITSLTIPDTVTYIGNEAFVRCPNLTSVNLGNGVVTLDVNVFVNCTSLTSITLPDSLVNLNGQPFRGCTALETLVVGSGVNSINGYKFSGCPALSSITVSSNNITYDSRDNCNAVIKSSTNELVLGCKDTVIPNTVTKLGDQAFSGCTNLSSMTIPNNVTSIGENAFKGCTGLTSLTIPNSVTSIGRQVFYGCAALTSITIPDNVTSDVQEWFHSCDALTTVVLGSGITRIKAWAFRNDQALRSLTVKAVTPPVCEDNAFGQSAVVGIYNNYCDIYVPAGSVDAYKTADGWSAAASRIQAIPNS